MDGNNMILDDLFDCDSVMEKIGDAFEEISDKIDDFCTGIEEFSDSLGSYKTNNYGDLPEDEWLGKSAAGTIHRQG